MSNKKLQSAKIIDRLKQYLNFKTDTQLSDFLEVSQSTISTWKKRNSFDLDIIIAKCEDIDLNWLLAEEAETTEMPSLPQAQETEASSAVATIPANRVQVLPVKVFDVKMAAGSSGYITEEHTTDDYYIDIAEVEIFTRTLPQKPFAYRVWGDSMLPDYLPGELVLIEPFSGSITDSVYVIRLDDGVLLKQVQRLPNRIIRILSLNTNYPPFEVPLDGSVDIQFLGRACGRFVRS